MASDCLYYARQACARWMIDHSNVSAFGRSPIRRREVLLARALLPPRKTRIGRDQGACSVGDGPLSYPAMGNLEVPSCSSKTRIRRIPAKGKRPGSTRLMKVWFSARGVAAMTEANGSPPTSLVASKEAAKRWKAPRSLLFGIKKGEPGASMLSPLIRRRHRRSRS